MRLMPSQSQLQTKIFKQQINMKSTDYFGRLVSRYLVSRFRDKIKFPLLDAGAGEGALIIVLRKEYPQKRENIIGLDLVPVPNLNIKKGNLKDIKFDDNYFKTIFCSEVLEHLDSKSLSSALKEFYRILSDNGYLICTFPYDEDLSRLTYTCPYCDKSFHKYGHVQSWHRVPEVMEMFTKHGFQVASFEILPLGAVAKIPLLKYLAPILNKLNNPNGFKKRVLIVLTK